MALEGFEIPGRPFPRRHFQGPGPAQECPGFALVVERGERGDEDVAAVDETGSGAGNPEAKVPARSVPVGPCPESPSPIPEQPLAPTGTCGDGTPTRPSPG